MGPLPHSTSGCSSSEANPGVFLFRIHFCSGAVHGPKRPALVRPSPARHSRYPKSSGRPGLSPRLGPPRRGVGLNWGATSSCGSEKILQDVLAASRSRETCRRSLVDPLWASGRERAGHLWLFFSLYCIDIACVGFRPSSWRGGVIGAELGLKLSKCTDGTLALWSRSLKLGIEVAVGRGTLDLV